MRYAALLSLLLVSAPPGDPWVGADKVKHFLMSAFVQSVVYSGARAAGLDSAPAQASAGAATLAIGVWKERRDAAQGKPFSVRDLSWDAAGMLAAAALLNGAR